MRDDPPVGGGLVALEGLADTHDPVQSGQQHLTQADPAGAVMRVGGICVGQDLLPGEPQQVMQLFGGEAEAAVVDRDGVQELLPGRRWQAVVQGAAAVRIDVDAVALQPVGAGSVRS